MYLVEMRPWFVGIPLKPPAVCGRVLPNAPPGRDEEPGRMEPAMLSTFPVERELPEWVGLNEARCCSGREKPWPSYRVTTRIPGFGVITGAWVRASEAAIAFSCVGVAAPERPPGLFSFSVMVDVEGDREKVLGRDRWVSFNFLVIFHDIAAVNGSSRGR